MIKKMGKTAGVFFLIFLRRTPGDVTTRQVGGRGSLNGAEGGDGDSFLSGTVG